MEKRRYGRISMPEIYGQTSYVVPLGRDHTDITELNQDCSVGDKVVVEVIEMTDEEYGALGDFNGW